MGSAARVFYTPRHELTELCWCRPRVEEGAGGSYVRRHRLLALRPDSQLRAFVPIRRGPPA